MIRPIALTLLNKLRRRINIRDEALPASGLERLASVPTALDAAQSFGKIAVTDLVVARPPEALESWLAERRYLANSTLLSVWQR